MCDQLYGKTHIGNLDSIIYISMIHPLDDHWERTTGLWGMPCKIGVT